MRVIEMSAGATPAGQAESLFDIEDLTHYVEEAIDEFAFVVLALVDRPTPPLEVGDFLRVVAICDSFEAAHLIVEADLGHAAGVRPTFSSVMLSLS